MSFFLLLAGVNLFAQPNEIKLSFGEKINPDIISNYEFDGISWLILDKGGNEISKGESNDFGSFVFKNPGSYTIRLISNEVSVNHTHSCNHRHIPEQFIVNVSPHKIVYHTDSIYFEDDVRASFTEKSNSIFIPVTIYSKDPNKSFSINPVIYSHGAKTTIHGILTSDNLVFTPGHYILRYQLAGTALKGTYIGFDLIDFNGNIHSYALKNPVK